MFGLSAKERLSKIILDFSRNHIDEFLQNISDTLSENPDGDEESIQDDFLCARRKYLDDVSNDVLSAIKDASPAIGFKCTAALVSPSFCGYPDMDFSDGLMAGSLYAICYHALTNKIAAQKDCVALNHLQAEIVDMALQQLSQ